MSANQVLAPNDTEASVEWTDKERHEAIAAMRDALAGTPAEPPTPAPYGVRWSDVWISVYWGVADYEMAILRFTEETEGRMVFELESALDEPATLVIEKVAPPECIRSHATVGSFGQREEIARGLEVSFRRYLEAFGKKPGFEKPGFRWELPPKLADRCTGEFTCELTSSGSVRHTLGFIVCQSVAVSNIRAARRRSDSAKGFA